MKFSITANSNSIHRDYKYFHMELQFLCQMRVRALLRTYKVKLNCLCIIGSHTSPQWDLCARACVCVFYIICMNLIALFVFVSFPFSLIKIKTKSIQQN